MAGYLLDTNVVSELIRSAPDENVVSWVESQDTADLFLAATTMGELIRGVWRLAEGRRRARYEKWIHEDLKYQFEGRILPFDQEAAMIWGEIMGEAERRGRPKAGADAQIAAIARRHGLVMVTRNTRDFADMSVELLDPWKA